MGNVLFEARDLAFSYPASAGQVFSGASFSVHAGEKAALLGDNGSGKSTLLRLIAGELAPEGGKIFRRKGEVFLLRQEEAAAGGMSAMAWLLGVLSGQGRACAPAEGVCERLRARIYAEAAAAGFDGRALERPVETFSGGERKMLALMGGFLRGPDLYLLDEPTNYLDGEALAGLVRAINAFRGACLVVSHDRAFLDKCVVKVFELERRAFSVYAGNYTAYAEQKRAHFERAGREKERIEREIEGLREMARNYKDWGAAKEKEKKGAADKGFIGARAARLQKRSARAAYRARRKIEELELTKPFVEKVRRVFFSGAGAAAFLEASGLEKRFGDRTLFKGLSFCLKPGDRLCVEGGNGSGKSTLLRLLAGETRPDRGEVVRSGAARVFYLPQFGRSGIGELKGSELFPPGSVRAACAMLDHLGAEGGTLFLPLAELSEGQRRKVALAGLLTGGADIALLDEPATHQDIRTIGILEASLLSFPGILVFVSHDEAFREKVKTASLILGSRPGEPA